jgi:hypothetical protein
MAVVQPNTGGASGVDVDLGSASETVVRYLKRVTRLDLGQMSMVGTSAAPLTIDYSGQYDVFAKTERKWFAGKSDDRGYRYFTTCHAAIAAAEAATVAIIALDETGRAVEHLINASFADVFPTLKGETPLHNSAVAFAWVEDCKPCSAMGQVQCHSCAGHGRTRCRQCDDDGQVRCFKCNGQGTVWTQKQSSSGTWHGSTEQCDWCYYAGRVRCPSCRGSCYHRCNTCRASGRLRCTTCKGNRFNTVYVRPDIQLKAVWESSVRNEGSPTVKEGLLAYMAKGAIRRLAGPDRRSYQLKRIGDNSTRWVASLSLEIQQTYVTIKWQGSQLAWCAGPAQTLLDGSSLVAQLLCEDICACEGDVARRYGWLRPLRQCDRVASSLAKLLESDVAHETAKAKFGVSYDHEPVVPLGERLRKRVELAAFHSAGCLKRRLHGLAGFLLALAGLPIGIGFDHLLALAHRLAGDWADSRLLLAGLLLLLPPLFWIIAQRAVKARLPKIDKQLAAKMSAGEGKPLRDAYVYLLSAFCVGLAAKVLPSLADIA